MQQNSFVGGSMIKFDILCFQYFCIYYCWFSCTHKNSFKSRKTNFYFQGKFYKCYLYSFLLKGIYKNSQSLQSEERSRNRSLHLILHLAAAWKPCQLSEFSVFFGCELMLFLYVVSI